MKTEDYDKLKQLCDENGFELGFKYDENTYTVRKTKDIWNGVDYCTDGIKVYRIFKIFTNWVYYANHIDGSEERTVKSFLKPSTEQAYIEQLKKIAFEKFGEIKISDRFNLKPISEMWAGCAKILKTTFDYDKHTDSLYIDGYIIYKQGKWAEKLPERVKVELADWNYENGDYFSDRFSISFLLKNLKKRDYYKIGKFLSKQLETYLNDTNSNKD